MTAKRVIARSRRRRGDLGQAGASNDGHQEIANGASRLAMTALGFLLFGAAKPRSMKSR